MHAGDTGTHADILLQALPDQAPGNQAGSQVALPSAGKEATSNAQCAQPPEPSRPATQEPEDSNSEGSLTPEQQGGPVSTSAAGLQLPRETVTKLRSTLSHPSEFWVTSVENYEANGVLFKGNLRAKDVQKAYASTASRLKVCLLLHAVHGTTVTSRGLPIGCQGCLLLQGCVLCMVTASHSREAASSVPARWIHLLWQGWGTPADCCYAVYGSCAACSPMRDGVTTSRTIV